MNSLAQFDDESVHSDQTGLFHGLDDASRRYKRNETFYNHPETNSLRETNRKIRAHSLAAHLQGSPLCCNVQSLARALRESRLMR